jgi:hypothetical protein
MSNQGGGLGSVVTPLVLKIIGSVITIVWLISAVADAFIPSYDPPETIGLAFMAMLSAVLGAAAVKGQDKKDDPPPPAPPTTKGADDDSE